MANINRKKISRDFREQLSRFTDHELVDSFNRRVGSKSWGFMLSIYIRELMIEIVSRGIDVNHVINGKEISFQHSVFLRDQKFYRLSDLDEGEAFQIISEYLYKKMSLRFQKDDGLLRWDENIICFHHFGTNTEISFATNRIAKDMDFVDSLRAM